MYVNKIKTRQKVLSLNEKLSEVQFLRFACTSDLSCIASPAILFANVNFTQSYARKNYATLEINPKTFDHDCCTHPSILCYVHPSLFDQLPLKYKIINLSIY